jgi:glycerol-3-phosphate dehydrogenase
MMGQGSIVQGDASFDVVVVGGGIVGSCIASLAARHGFSTALVERADFGGGVSANSLKVIHGGLRYLQHLDFARMRESIGARALLMRIAPELVKPRGFVMPLASFGPRSRWPMTAALRLNDWMAYRYGGGKSPRLPDSRTLTPAEMAETFPFLSRTHHHHGGALWYDAVAEDTERLTLAFALDAERHGAVIANYKEVTGVTIKDGCARGVEMMDVDRGVRSRTESRRMLWAAGGTWAAVNNFPVKKGMAPPGWVRAVNLVLDIPWPSEWCLGLPVESPNGITRNLFFVPWRSGTMVGTWYTPCPGDARDLTVSTNDIEAALSRIRLCLPGVTLSRRHIAQIHCGLLPASREGSDHPSRREWLRSGLRDGLPEGFTLLQGVKYTTAPILAAKALARVARGVTRDSALRLWTEPLPDASPPPAAWTPGHIRHAINKEHARHLSDVVMRRLGIGSFLVPERDTLRAVAQIMAPLTGWDHQAQELEINALIALEAPAGLTGHDVRCARDTTICND